MSLVVGLRYHVYSDTLAPVCAMRAMGKFYFLSRCHYEVAKLVDYDHYVWHEFMPVVRVQEVVYVFLVVLLDISHPGFFKHVVPGVHEFTQALECSDNLLTSVMIGLSSSGSFAMKCLGDWGVWAELNLFRVYQHQFQFVGVFLVKQ